MKTERISHSSSLSTRSQTFFSEIAIDGSASSSAERRRASLTCQSCTKSLESWRPSHICSTIASCSATGSCRICSIGVAMVSIVPKRRVLVHAVRHPIWPLAGRPRRDSNFWKRQKMILINTGCRIRLSCFSFGPTANSRAATRRLACSPSDNRDTRPTGGSVSAGSLFNRAEATTDGSAKFRTNAEGLRHMLQHKSS